MASVAFNVNIIYLWKDFDAIYTLKAGFADGHRIVAVPTKRRVDLAAR